MYYDCNGNPVKWEDKAGEASSLRTGKCTQLNDSYDNKLAIVEEMWTRPFDKTNTFAYWRAEINVGVYNWSCGHFVTATEAKDASNKMLLLCKVIIEDSGV